MRYQDVVRLDVAVDEPFLVGTVQSLGDLGNQLHGVALGHLAFALDLLAERLAVHVLHHQVGRRAGVAEFQGLDDIGMVELLGGHVFLLEAFEQDLVAGHVRRNDLDGHDLSGEAVLAFIDGPHAALGDPFDEVIITDALQSRSGGIQRHGRASPRSGKIEAAVMSHWSISLSRKRQSSFGK